MSTQLPMVGDTVRLAKFPPNRALMDWDRILTIHQPGRIQEVQPGSKDGGALYRVWFSSRSGVEGWDVWLSHVHFTASRDQFDNNQRVGVTPWK